MRLPKEEDPFWEPSEDVLIGTSNVFLQSLSYALDFDDKLAVTDYKGLEEGSLYVNVKPCEVNGQLLDHDYFVDNPEELLSKPYHFKVTIRCGEIVKARYSKGTHVKYRVFKDNEYTQTKVIKNTLSPEYNHSKVFSFDRMTQELLDYFDKGCITFLLYGLQEDSNRDHRLAKMTTKELRQMEQIVTPGVNMGQVTRRQSISVDASESSYLRSELMLMTKRFQRLESKEKRIIQLCEDWEKKNSSEQQFAPFHRQVSAVANSTGTRLRTRLQVLNQNNAKKPSNEDTVSLFVFGEEEDSLQRIANKNDGVLHYAHLENVYGPGYQPHIITSPAIPENGNMSNGNMNQNEGLQSRTCVIQ